MNIPVDFRHLQTFSKVAELRSFSRAAEDLGLTQPTVSGHILALERWLGIRLFDRTAKEARLTKGGGLFYQYASQMLAYRKDLLNVLSEFSQGIRGELCIGASTIPGEYLLPRLLAEFKKDRPNLMISLRIADSKEVARYVIEGRVDFGMTGAKVDHPSLRYELFGQDEIVIVGPPSAGESDGNLTIDELSNLPWIIREEGSGTQMAVEKALRKKNGSIRQFKNFIQMGSTSSVREAVKTGFGFAFISKRAVEHELENGSLRRFHVKEIEPIFRQIYIVLNEARTLSPPGHRFLRYLRKRRDTQQTQEGS